MNPEDINIAKRLQAGYVTQYSTMKNNWKEEFEKLWVLPTEFTPSSNEPIYDLNKRKQEILVFLEEEIKTAYKAGQLDVMFRFEESDLVKQAHQSGREETLEQVSSWIAEGCAETDTMVDLAKFLRKKLNHHE